jgi:hypothetical protein
MRRVSMATRDELIKKLRILSVGFERHRPRNRPPLVNEQSVMRCSAHRNGCANRLAPERWRGPVAEKPSKKSKGRCKVPINEHEAKMISERTKAALAAAKRRGVKLGGDRGARLTAKARQAGCKAVQVRADARAAGPCPHCCRAKGERRSQPASHRRRTQRTWHPNPARRRPMAGRKCESIAGAAVRGRDR